MVLTIGTADSTSSIQMLRMFFAHTPSDIGMAYVVVLHHSQTRDDHIIEVLRQATKMPVLYVAAKTRIEQNYIYLIPSDKHLTLEDGFISLSPASDIEGGSAPVNIFFHSNADSQKELSLDVSERRKAELALQRSEERLKLAATVSNFGIHDFDVLTGHIYWSPELKAMQGIAPDKNLTFEEVLSTIHPDDRARVELELRGAMATDSNGEFEQEFRIIRQDNGEVVWMYNRSRTLFEGEGMNRHPVRNTGIAINITERKKAEEALHTANTSINEILESIGDVFYALDSGFRYTYVNKRAEQAWGIPAQEVLGRTVWEVFPQFQGTESEAMHVKAMETREILHYETFSTIVHRWIAVGIFPAAHGGLSVFFHDIEDRKRAEEALRQSEQRLRVTTESAIDYAIIGMDPDRIIQSWSRGAERILGWSEEEAVGQTADIIFTPEDRAAGAPQLEMETARDKGMSPDERWHIRKDGTRFFMSGVMRPIYNGDVLSGYVKVARDLTDRHLMEEQRETFIGVASHELKTPLSSIKAYSEVLQDIFAESGDDQSAKLMRKMESQIDRLTNLVRALLDVTRIREGKIELQKEPFALDTLLHEVVDDMQMTTPISLLIKDEEPIDIVADRKGITQVIVNLLSNAIKYAQGTEHIDLSLRIEEGEAIVRVRDYGIGMSKEESEQVFDRFYRGQNGGAGTYPGLGLGLYISAEIIRLHGGRIWVDSELGKGSMFSFALPV
jgi:PAS domain S-box-containing protein